MSEQTIVVPSSPEDRKKIKGVIEAMSNALTRIEGERSYISEAAKELADEYNLPKKEINRMLRDFHKGSYSASVDQFEDYMSLYESVIGNPDSESDEE